ncbi:magnesium and cobalt transport protein CorA [Corynebacterium breve]|uniref:Magnesium and cobalt transport protein CorA n=1 Tax=Corynebacterium breve TaxID=3049799 RepID=A0ABY8VHL2_9CORY|nr:magnesium and cobalt transport protein CorA [Corynebacterium breve]WIM68817.1 magnesium and cobalt transport protein CorA [Corynebacterium breve]
MPPLLPRMNGKAAKPSPRMTVPVERSIDHCYVYHEGKRLPGEYHFSSALEKAHEASDGFVWLSLKEPDNAQMERVADAFSIHKLIVEDAVLAHQRPKVERYDDQLFIVVRSVNYADDEEVTDARQIISTGEAQMLIGRDFIISVRHNAWLNRLAQELDQEPELTALGPAAIAWKIANDLVEDYSVATAALSADVDELENEVFTPERKINIDKIYMYKREILEMKHATAPLGPALRTGIAANKDVLGKQIRSYFRDVLDNAMIVNDQVAGFDERLSSLLDASVAKVTMQQNSDMRTISAVVGMAAAPTLIAGIYGMNFTHMPELDSRYGYPVALLLMLLVVLLMFWWFRRNNWL